MIFAHIAGSFRANPDGVRAVRFFEQVLSCRYFPHNRRAFSGHLVTFHADSFAKSANVEDPSRVTGLDSSNVIAEEPRFSITKSPARRASGFGVCEDS